MKDRVTDINHALLEASVEKGFAMNEFEVNRMPRPVALDRMLRAGMAIAEIKRTKDYKEWVEKNRGLASSHGISLSR